MFKRLQQKWNVSAKQFWIIFIVFGLTGTTTAYLTKAIVGILGMNESTWWVWKLLLRLGMLIIGYQIILLTYGFLLGQWKFFWKYEKKILQKLRILKRSPDNVATPDIIINIAIFASGAGTNAANIIRHFKQHPYIKIKLVVCNKAEAGVFNIAQRNNVDTLLINKHQFFEGDGYADELRQASIDFIVLAGFLWKVPQCLINIYRNRIINIHPALLPKYGGKGMYGSKVHESVIAAGETESGITIHYVDEHYDNGDEIFQAKCAIEKNETAGTLAKKVHALEYEHFPIVIERCVEKLTREKQHDSQRREVSI